jgi:hypothetical protein
MLKFLFLIITVCGCFSLTCGQIIVKGKVFEDRTRITLTDVQVQNINNKELVITDNNGKYAIKAKVGDILVFSGFSYQTDTLAVIDLHQKEVFLLPKQNMLNMVNVNSTAAPSTFKFYDPMFHGQTVIYQRDANLNPIGGVIFRFWYWKKDEKKRAKQETVIADEQLREKIGLVFSTVSIGHYVPLKGAELNDFVTLYMPNVKTYTGNDFNLLTYVDSCYKMFIKHPPAK